MNEKILISYIIPAYNAADTLERAVENIRLDIYIIYRKIVTLIYMELILNEKKLLQIQIMLGHLIQKN